MRKNRHSSTFVFRGFIIVIFMYRLAASFSFLFQNGPAMSIFHTNVATLALLLLNLWAFCISNHHQRLIIPISSNIKQKEGLAPRREHLDCLSWLLNLTILALQHYKFSSCFVRTRIIRRLGRKHRVPFIEYASHNCQHFSLQSHGNRT